MSATSPSSSLRGSYGVGVGVQAAPCTVLLTASRQPDPRPPEQPAGGPHVQARVAVRMVPVRGGGGTRPMESSCLTSPTANPPDPRPAPSQLLLRTPAPPLPAHCSAAPLDSSSRPPRSCKDRGWAGRRSPLVAVGLRHRTSPGVNPHGMAHSAPCALKGGSTAGWEHLTHAPGVSGRPDPL